MSASVVTTADLVALANAGFAAVQGLRELARDVQERGPTDLYSAHRDVCALHGQSGYAWDLVAYTGIPLATGDCCRSIGHWNAPLQSETFWLLFGEAVIAWVDPHSPRVVTVERLSLFRATRIEPGAFHLTFAIGRTGVLNRYERQTDVGDKYRRRPPPVLMSLYPTLRGAILTVGEADNVVCLGACDIDVRIL